MNISSIGVTHSIVPFVVPLTVPSPPVTVPPPPPPAPCPPCPHCKKASMVLGINVPGAWWLNLHVSTSASPMLQVWFLHNLLLQKRMWVPGKWLVLIMILSYLLSLSAGVRRGFRRKLQKVRFQRRNAVHMCTRPQERFFTSIHMRDHNNMILDNMLF